MTLALQTYQGNVSEKRLKASNETREEYVFGNTSLNPCVYVLDNEARLKLTLLRCDEEREVWIWKSLPYEPDQTDLNQQIGVRQAALDLQERPTHTQDCNPRSNMTQRDQQLRTVQCSRRGTDMSTSKRERRG
ncbi:hypothetical protein DPEC_G00339580 [Dallia pectoralis]|uniref:Uncharacterized protein n=1 Tax=Dallia pectoralis TaxID=75939 RepID=A0ACC2F4Y7_DALPE|nr:hypothetical protein DPEC_G00339580 [Dallia pectoralis]